MEDKLTQVITSSIKGHPIQWLQVYNLLTSYDRHHMQNPQIVGQIVDSLSEIIGINLTPDRRSSTIQWLIKQQIDPKSVRKFSVLFLQSITESTQKKSD